jgi:hypothetical protein
METAAAKLLGRMVGAKQLSPADAGVISAQVANGKPELVQSEESVLRWLAGEYHLNFTTLENIEPDPELISLFPASILTKEELLPLHRLDGVIQVATSRLFATQGMDTLKSLTGLKLNPILAPSEAVYRVMKSHLPIQKKNLPTPIIKTERPLNQTAALYSTLSACAVFFGFVWLLNACDQYLPPRKPLLFASVSAMVVGAIGLKNGIPRLRKANFCCPVCLKKDVMVCPKDLQHLAMGHRMDFRQLVLCRDCQCLWTTRIPVWAPISCFVAGLFCLALIISSFLQPLGKPHNDSTTTRIILGGICFSALASGFRMFRRSGRESKILLV